MAKMQIVQATHEHILPIATNLRQSDLDELEASSGQHPIKIVTEGFNSSSKCWTIMVDNHPSVIFGVAPICVLSGVASPWLLGTDESRKVRRVFLVEGRKHVKEMLDMYPRLINYVDARNKQSIRWLKWLGFAIMPAIKYGVNGELFHPFEMRAY